MFSSLSLQFIVIFSYLRVHLKMLLFQYQDIFFSRTIYLSHISIHYIIVNYKLGHLHLRLSPIDGRDVYLSRSEVNPRA